MDFKNVIPQIIPTDKIDVYDVIFNIQMPETVPPPPGSSPPPTGSSLASTTHDNEDFYCNNKLRVTLNYVIDPNKTKYFSSTTGQGQETACVLSPPTEIAKAAAEYDFTESAGTSGTEPQSSLQLVKPKGIYFTTYDKLNEKIKKVFEDTYKKLYDGFKCFSDVNTTTGESLKQAHACEAEMDKVDELTIESITASKTNATEACKEASRVLDTLDDKMKILDTLTDYFDMVNYPDSSSTDTVSTTITDIKKQIIGSNNTAKKANTDIEAYFDALLKLKKFVDVSQAADKKLESAE